MTTKADLDALVQEREYALRASMAEGCLPMSPEEREEAIKRSSQLMADWVDACAYRQVYLDCYTDTL